MPIFFKSELDKCVKRAAKNDPWLTEINLNNKNIGDAGAAKLASALSGNTHLQTLDLRWNNIGPDGASSLASALQENTTLKTLELYYNSIGPDGASSLASALQRNTTLQKLLLGYNSIGDQGASLLASALQRNSTLQELWLRDNNIGPEGASSLVSALRRNHTLRYISVFGNNINDDLKRKVDRLVEINKAGPAEAARQKYAEFGPVDDDDGAAARRRAAEAAAAAEQERQRREAEAAAARQEEERRRLASERETAERRRREEEAAATERDDEIRRLQAAAEEADRRKKALAAKEERARRDNTAGNRAEPKRQDGVDRPAFATRAALDDAIAQCEDTVRAALGDSIDLTVTGDIFDRAAAAEVKLEKLKPLRDGLPTKAELAESISGLSDRMNGARRRRAWGEAKAVQAKIKNLTLQLEAEREAERASAYRTRNEIARSRDAILKSLRSTSPSPADGISPRYLEACTNHWSESNRIGSGGFGEVFRGIDDEAGVAFAVKRIHPHMLRGLKLQGTRKSIMREVEVLSKYSHPNIIRLLGHCLSDEKDECQCLIYELAAGGSLGDILSTEEGRKDLDWRKRVRTSVSLVSALSYLHNKGCYHRDVKVDNICFWDDFEKAVLIDYGIAKFADGQTLHTTLTREGALGSLLYMAPEYRNPPSGSKPVFDGKSEVFSVGVVLLALMSGQHQLSLDTVSNRESASSLLASGIDQCAGKWDASVLKSMSSIALRCLEHDPSKRPTMAELLEELLLIDQTSQEKPSRVDSARAETALVTSRLHGGGGQQKLARTGTCSCSRQNVPGLMCRAGASSHFCCNACFSEHVLENLGSEQIRCREEGCSSRAFTFDQICNHVGTSLFSRHVREQERNQLVYKNFLQMREDMERAIRDEVKGGVNQVTKALESIGGDELACPLFCVLVPLKSNRHDFGSLRRRTLQRMKGCVKTTMHLYFLCAYDKTPVTKPIRLCEPKKWVKKAAPALKACIMALQVSAAVAGVPIRIPVPGDIFSDQLAVLDQFLSDFVSADALDTLQDLLVMCSGAEDGESYHALNENARRLTHESYQEIARVAQLPENVGWKNEMVLCANSAGAMAWVRQENEEKWRRSM